MEEFTDEEWARLPFAPLDVRKALRRLAKRSDIVDKLLENGLQPWVTLYHWDLPQALQDRGGWPERDIAGWFADYAHIVFEKLGDRVEMWATHNEPYVVAFLGYQSGIFPPGPTPAVPACGKDWPGCGWRSKGASRQRSAAVPAIPGRRTMWT